MNSSANNIRTSRVISLRETDAAIRHARPYTTRHGPCDALVLDASRRQALVTLRSLGSRGFSIAALDAHDKIPAFSSRWCQQKVVGPAAEGTNEYLINLERVLDFTGAKVLIPCSDGTIALLRQHRERLEQRVRIALAKEPAMSIAINKEQTLEIASKLGLGVPRGVHVKDVSEVKAAVCEVGLPAVIKPVESWLCNGQQGVRVVCQLATTFDEAHRAVEELIGSGGTALFQQFLPGKRESLSFLFARGEIHARFAQAVKRTYPPLGGTIVLRQSIPFPSDTGEQAERLVREIELEGYSEVEFRRDSAGKPYLMEINPRLNESVEIAVRAGIDFPYLLYQWANGDRINVVKDYRVGGWMRHLGGDIATTVAAIQQRGRPGVAPPAQALRDFFLSFFLPTAYDYFDWRDPLPAWTATKGFVYFVLPWVGKRILKKFRS